VREVTLREARYVGLATPWCKTVEDDVGQQDEFVKVSN
jgi:hypothetical protein